MKKIPWHNPKKGPKKSQKVHFGRFIRISINENQNVDVRGIDHCNIYTENISRFELPGGKSVRIHNNPFWKFKSLDYDEGT